MKVLLRVFFLCFDLAILVAFRHWCGFEIAVLAGIVMVSAELSMIYVEMPTKNEK